ncbi:MAG TPA: hypothetical protein VF494_06735 [Candidatus Limnocylindrales bacterium]
MERPPQSRQQRPPRSRVALLGTLGHLHGEAARYNFKRLRTLVETLEPDLLAVEVEPDDWESGVPERLPLEVRLALAPASRLTDVVVVPLGAEPRLDVANEDGRLGRFRAALIQRAEDLLTSKARAIDDPAGVSRGAYVHLCSGMCNLEAAAAGKDGRVAWARANDRVIERLREVVARNPGSRVLVAVNCRRLHVLTRRLRGLTDEVELVRFEDLIPRDPLACARSARAQEGTSR